jgi:hypothetical protein
MLTNWWSWVEMAGVYYPRWPEHLPDQILALEKRLNSAVWSNQLPALEASLKHLSAVASRSARHYIVGPAKGPEPASFLANPGKRGPPFPSENVIRGVVF